MRCLGLAIVAVAAIVAPLDSPALAASDSGLFHGSIGVIGAPNSRLGLEAEFSVGAFHLGGLSWDPMFGDEQAATIWGGYAWMLPWGDRLMPIVGGTHYGPTGMMCQAIGTCEPPTQNGFVVGASYLIREERLWIQITPQYLFTPGGTTGYPQWAMSGLPWVELGIPVTPFLDVSFRLGETIFKVALKV